MPECLLSFSDFPVCKRRSPCVPDLDTKASGLSIMSQKYRKDARSLNMRSLYAKVAAGGVCLLVFILYFWVL